MAKGIYGLCPPLSRLGTLLLMTYHSVFRVQVFQIRILMFYLFFFLIYSSPEVNRASDYSREYDGACLQMRLSYSPCAHIFLFMVQWSDCYLAGALGLIRILIYKVVLYSMNNEDLIFLFSFCNDHENWWCGSACRPTMTVRQPCLFMKGKLL